jgi:hypothetical protein
MARAADLLSTAALSRCTEERWHDVEQTSAQERRMGLGFVLGGVGSEPIPQLEPRGDE